MNFALPELNNAPLAPPIQPLQQLMRATQALHGVAATRALEQTWAARLPAHRLMQSAGLATARLALAIAPHAQRFWIACGPGNNGGDGLEAAMHLQQWDKTVQVSWLGKLEHATEDARASHLRAVGAGVQFIDTLPDDCDCVIDALLGIGATRAPQGVLADVIAHINRLSERPVEDAFDPLVECSANPERATHRIPVLAVDVPSGLNADTGTAPGPCVRASHTLSLLTLKPGLYTAQGRDQAGQIWLHDLDVDRSGAVPQAWLNAPPAKLPRPHASHKGSYGDLAVVGGAPGMCGAALLAASAALHQGAGRVFVGMLDGGCLTMDSAYAELMFRTPCSLQLGGLTVVAGCGGGSAIAAELPRLLSAAPRLVLDADGLNAVANDTQLQALLAARRSRHPATVLTPHPLEAARLLGCSTAQVQQDRLQAAQQLAERFGACVVLKGSGTVIAAPQTRPVINPTGNARLATAGTGDVLAGFIGAQLAQWTPSPEDALARRAAEICTAFMTATFRAACAAVWSHGQAADQWPKGQPLTASALARTLG